MRKNHALGPIAATITATALLVLAGCVPRASAPPPSPTPSPTRPAPPPPPAPPPADWRDAPVTPGTWIWSREGAHSVARFGGGLLTLRCDRAAGTVTLLRPGTGPSAVPVTITTTSGSRTISGTPVAGPPPAIAASLSARDPHLDAMVFSRGRFAVAVPGLPTLYVPSWPEVARVVEDCR